MSTLLTGKLHRQRTRTKSAALDAGAIPGDLWHAGAYPRGCPNQNLGLAVIDEQHRFGVFDRARLIALGRSAHVMLMTATPIPRSLAQTLFRNLDVSALDEMPPGRTPIVTEIFSGIRR